METCFRVQDSCYLGCHLNMVGWNAKICLKANSIVNYHICDYLGYLKIHKHIVSFPISHILDEYKINLSDTLQSQVLQNHLWEILWALNRCILDLWKIIFWKICTWLLVRNICSCLSGQEVKMSWLETEKGGIFFLLFCLLYLLKSVSSFHEIKI